jgi:polysaccharide pyruvyl transferase WcaK-like protein
MNSFDSARTSQSAVQPTTGGMSDVMGHVGVLGHFGDSNLGDEAIIEAFVTRVRREWPAGEVRIFSMHPADSRRRYRCEAHALRRATEYEDEFRPLEDFLAEAVPTPDRPATDEQTPISASPSVSPVKRIASRLGELVPHGRIRSTVAAVVRGAAGLFKELGFLWRCLGRVKGLDVMYVTGSNQFLDNFGGPWGFPYTLLKWTLLCRLVGCRVAFVSVGAGPLDRPLSHWMIARAIGLADYVSFRDEGSRRLILDVTGHDGPVLPDLAHSLDARVSAPLITRRTDRRGPLRIAINAMPVHDPRYWHRPDEDKYRQYVASLAHVCNGLLTAGHELSFFATQFPDARVARDVAIEACGADAAKLMIRVPMTVQELLEVLRQADIVVATRFHGILLSLLMARPTVGICYYRKSRELLSEAGLLSYAFDIDGVDAEALESAVMRLIDVGDDVSRTVTLCTQAYRDALEGQYKTLFDMVRRRHAVL